MSSWIRRHPLIAFFALAYALSWWPWLWTALDATAPSTILPPRKQIVRWRVGLRWYALVLLLPPAITIGAVSFTVLCGFAWTPHFAGWPDFAGRFAFILLFIGLGEEPAWRGFALPRLMAERSALADSLILGVLDIVWHLPLFGIEYDPGNIGP